MSVKLSKKHGLNPSMTVCFWCGKETGVAILGELPHDEEAPRRVFGGYEPCDECKKIMKQGIWVFEADTKPTAEGQPPMGISETGTQLYPTGNYIVMSPEAFKPGKLPPNGEMALSVEAFQGLCEEAEKQIGGIEDGEDTTRTTSSNSRLH